MAKAGPAGTPKDIRIKVILPSNIPRDPGTKAIELINLTSEKTIKASLKPIGWPIAKEIK